MSRRPDPRAFLRARLSCPSASPRRTFSCEPALPRSKQLQIPASALWHPGIIFFPAMAAATIREFLCPVITAPASKMRGEARDAGTRQRLPLVSPSRRSMGTSALLAKLGSLLIPIAHLASSLSMLTLRLRSRHNRRAAFASHCPWVLTSWNQRECLFHPLHTHPLLFIDPPSFLATAPTSCRPCSESLSLLVSLCLRLHLAFDVA